MWGAGRTLEQAAGTSRRASDGGGPGSHHAGGSTPTCKGRRGGERCRFVESNLAELELHEAFSLIIGVTVLQHILDQAQFLSAVNRIAQHLAPKAASC